MSIGKSRFDSNRLVGAQLYAKTGGCIRLRLRYAATRRATMSGFATSTEQECTMYSTAPAQEQGARLTTMRLRSKDF